MPTLTTLVSFADTFSGENDGALLADAAGDLFGTTAGSATNAGTVFEIPFVNGSYASTLTTLATFNALGLNGSVPLGGLIADSAGNLFGTTAGGGTYSKGTVFEIPYIGGSYASTPTTLLNFNGANGQNPTAGLISDAAGNLFGVTDSNVFELVNNGGGSYTPTQLASLNTNTAADPGTLVMDGAGDLFDTTANGGTNGQGSVFELVNDGGSYTLSTLASVSEAVGGLIVDTAGNLFGTTSPANGDGTVFEVSLVNGSYASAPTTLVSFNGADGSLPVGPLIADAAGNLFGTTEGGGANGDGTVFEMPWVNGAYASMPTTLASFSSAAGGVNPAGGLIANAAGDLFGTTGGGSGTVFELADTGFQPPVPPDLTGGFGTVYYTPNGAAVAIDTNIGVTDATSATLTGTTVAIGAGFLAGDTLNFTNQNGIAGNYNAATGVLSLTGTTSLADYQAAFESITFSSTSGNPSDSGADPSRTVSWTVTDGSLSSNTVTTSIDVSTLAQPTLITLVSFNGTDGSDPEAGVIADPAGDLFGTTYLGGMNSLGMVFEILNNGGSYASTPTTLVDCYGGLGTLPAAGLIADGPGVFLGTASTGGANGDGTVFVLGETITGSSITIDVNTLVSFDQANINSTEGITPDAGLVMDTGRDLFGTTAGGGANNDGTVFALPSMFGSYPSTPVTLVSFNGATDGSNPQASVIVDASGNVFGTTYGGGTNGGGTVFEIPYIAGSYASTPTTLVSFANTLQPGAAAGLIKDAAGDLFDTTYAGGANSYGSVFEIAKTSTGYASTPTTLVSFDGTDGATPEAGLIIDAAGDLFGTTTGGGTYGEGTVFEIPYSNGSYASAPTTLVSFNVANGDGAYPTGTLLSDAAGDLFGTTEQGGANGDGTVFELTGSGFVVACYCRGTRILTEKCEVAVEALAVGDQAKTLSGALKPIVWIGFGRDLVTRRNSLARPIVVRRGALADNVPRRDLYLTHGHSLYVDGVLIPVEHLVNHRSIRWDDTARVVEYYHIELDDHDVLFAEGAPAESYYDAGNRAFFQNTREGSEAGADKPTFAPVLTTGEAIERVWAALFERAGGRIERETTDDPDLHLVIDGERLDPASVADGVYTFALAGPPDGTLLLSSRSGVPSLIGLNRHEHRRLGVAIRQIVLHQPGVMTCFDCDAPLFSAGGSHAAESGYCWTDGELSLPAELFGHLKGAFTLLVHTQKQAMRYPISAAAAQAA